MRCKKSTKTSTAFLHIRKTSQIKKIIRKYINPSLRQQRYEINLRKQKRHIYKFTKIKQTKKKTEKEEKKKILFVLIQTKKLTKMYKQRIRFHLRNEFCH